jgi:hypothetical protein
MTAVRRRCEAVTFSSFIALTSVVIGVVSGTAIWADALAIRWASNVIAAATCRSESCASRV